jgi:negative regulator of sigma-B (phosphoserine phosphatase)
MSEQTVEGGIYMRPCQGEIVTGDMALCVPQGTGWFLAIADVLGHGPDAHAVAERIDAYLRENADPDLVGLMGRLHALLRGTLGAAVGLAYLDGETGRLRYVGLGNTCLRRFGSAATRLVSRDGTAGAHMNSLREEYLQLAAGDVVLLTTDGVREHFAPEDYPGLLGDSPAVVARLVVQKFGKDHDDATCLAVRYRP